MNNRTELTEWHQVVFGGKLDLLDRILADDVVFHTPLYLKPRKGKAATSLILRTVIEIFENFTYHREIIDGDSWMLEFSANIGGISLKGIDLIRWNEAGQIIDFEVYIRPLNGVQALGDAMYERLKAAGMLDMLRESSERS
ncbi:hypothetical protein MNBD_ALPHA03-1737 [hydrothermal vent metagenome]|uniref:SnoaL-like domain-containing protein n=1 Tax=hydrothermal vent metagenome TaxID=652676 RepID=A0A3B1AMW4_9ZZZZ